MTGLRILGAVLSVLLAAYAVRRYGRHQLRRGELFAMVVVAFGLIVAAVAPTVFNPLFDALGAEPGNQRRLIALLVLSNFFTLALVFRGFTKDDVLTDNMSRLVDFLALRRVEESGWKPVPGSCALIIPAYNEADNLPAVLDEIPKEVCGLPVMTIVCADGCTDATEAEAQSHGAMVIGSDLRRGQGAVIRLGYLAALEADARVIVSLDADGQHDPNELERVIRPILDGTADMVQGSRVMGSFEVESNIRKRGVTFFSKVMTVLGRTKITDPSNGYRAVSPEGLRRLDLTQDQFFVAEFVIDAANKGLRVIEVPITVRRRASGTSKKGTTFRYAYGFTKAIIGTWLRQPPGKREIPLEPRWLANSIATNAGNGRSKLADRLQPQKEPGPAEGDDKAATP
ncbi:MAG: DUF2304 family protein [Actinobacteria bacterium]|nr:DUF2304 family protein [Actinomycetota bacterium]